MSELIEKIAYQSVRATSTCLTIEPDVCGSCEKRLQSAREAAHRMFSQSFPDPDNSAQVETVEGAVEAHRWVFGKDLIGLPPFSRKSCSCGAEGLNIAQWREHVCRAVLAALRKQVAS